MIASICARAVSIARFMVEEKGTPPRAEAPRAEAPPSPPTPPPAPSAPAAGAKRTLYFPLDRLREL